MLNLIHEERCDPLALPPEARKGVYDIRDSIFLHFAKGKDVLELGCGCGYNAFLFSKKARKVVGVDVDKGAIEAASNHFKFVSNLTFVASDAIEYLNNIDTQFDIIILFEVIEHLSFEEQKVLMTYLHEKTKPGGQIFLSTPNGNHVPFYRKNPYHKRELNIEELKSLLHPFFKIELIKGQVPILWFFLPVPWVLLEKLWLFLGIYEKMCVIRKRVSLSRTIILRATHV